MKKIILIFILFSWFTSEAQIKIFGPDFRLTRSHRWGTFGISTSDTTFYTDSLRVKAFKPLRAGVYTTATAPAASAFPGYIIVNVDSNYKPQYSDSANWINLPGTGGGGGGSGTVTSVALAAGTSGTDVNISGSPITTSGTITLNIPDASATARGLITTGTQTIAGAKTWSGNAVFNGTATFNGTTQVGGTSNATLNLANSSNSVRGTIDVSSNNPRLNSATGIWVFASAGTTIMNLNGTGVFYGGGSGAVARIEPLAGTTTVPSLRFNLGVDQTTSITGSFDYAAVSSINRLAFTPTGSTKKRFVLSNDVAPANGQIPIGNGTDYTVANITSTGGSITVTNGAGTIDISTTLTLATGTYTPTITNSANVDATALAGTVYYQRIGNQVTVWGAVEIDVTSASTLTSIAISLPAGHTSALTNYSQLTGFIGSGSSNTGVGAVVGDATNDRAQCDFTCGTELASRAYSFRFSYEVL